MTEITLFPQPRQLERKPGVFALNRHTRLFAAQGEIGEWLAGLFASSHRLRPSRASA